MPHAVDDAPGFVEQKQVSVAAHQFDDEPQLHRVVQLVAPGQREHGDTVQPRLFDGNDAAADEMLP